MNAPKPRPRGRPKDPNKRQALLEAARKLLLAHGVDVTLDDIAAEAKVAKVTVYAHFSDKNSLIEAVLRRESDRTITDQEFEESKSMKIEETLTSFGLRYVSFINERELNGWDRLIASAATRHPDLPTRFFEAGPGRGQKMLKAIIAQAIQDEALNTEDAEQATEDLLGLWFGFSTLAIKLGARQALTQKEIQRRVDHGVQTFMQIYGS